MKLLAFFWGGINVLGIIAALVLSSPQQQQFVGDGQHRHLYLEATNAALMTDIAINRDLWRTHDTDHIATEVNQILTPIIPTATPQPPTSTRTPTRTPAPSATRTATGQFATPTPEDSAGLTRTPLTNVPTRTFTPTPPATNTPVPTALPPQVYATNAADVAIRVRSCAGISSACIVVATIKPGETVVLRTDHLVSKDGYLWYELWNSNDDAWISIGFADHSQRWIVWE